MDNKEHDNNENNDDKKKNEIKTSVIVCMILLLSVMMLFIYVVEKINQTQNIEIKYNEFIEKLEKGELKTVQIDVDRLVLTPKTEEEFKEYKEKAKLKKSEEKLSEKESKKDNEKEDKNDDEDNDLSDLEEEEDNDTEKDTQEDKESVDSSRESMEEALDIVGKTLGEENIAVGTTYYTGLMGDVYLVERLENATKEGKIESFNTKLESQSSKWADIIMNVVPLILFAFMLLFFWKMVAKGGGMMGVGKSNAKIYVEEETGVTFKDVAGQEEAKESLTEIVDFLHNPQKYRDAPEQRASYAEGCSRRS